MNKDFNESVMRRIAVYAQQTSEEGVGGPFGAAIVKDGNVVCITCNRVLADNDPTAHAEITAIREACKLLNTYDLAGCELYCTGAPCPMCLSAIIWANIETVYFCNDYEEAARIGFRDDHIYKYLRMPDPSESSLVTQYRVEVPEGKELYDAYITNQHTIY